MSLCFTLRTFLNLLKLSVFVSVSFVLGCSFSGKSKPQDPDSWVVPTPVVSIEPAPTPTRRDSPENSDEEPARVFLPSPSATADLQAEQPYLSPTFDSETQFKLQGQFIAENKLNTLQVLGDLALEYRPLYIPARSTLTIDSPIFMILHRLVLSDEGSGKILLQPLRDSCFEHERRFQKPALIDPQTFHSYLNIKLIETPTRGGAPQNVWLTFFGSGSLNALPLKRLTSLPYDSLYTFGKNLACSYCINPYLETDPAKCKQVKVVKGFDLLTWTLKTFPKAWTSLKTTIEP